MLLNNVNRWMWNSNYFRLKMQWKLSVLQCRVNNSDHLKKKYQPRHQTSPHETCVLSVLLYCAETWTLLKADVNRLQAFHMRSLRRILGIRWFDHVTNVEMKDRTRLEDIESRIRRRSLALFAHAARMPPCVPAHDALWSALGVRYGSAPDPSWKRPREGPRTSWAEQLREDLDGMVLREAWYLAMERWRGFATSSCC